MTFHRLFKILILVLAVAAVGLVLLPASATAQSPAITCVDAGDCTICFDQCQGGVVCFGVACSDGTTDHGCLPCTVVTKRQPGNFQNQKETHGEQGDKVLLARLLSKDPELSKALRSLK